MSQKDLYKDVEKNRYGYYELKGDFVKADIDSLYQDSYYQKEMSLYRKQYSERELEEKNYRLKEKRYVLEN